MCKNLQQQQKQPKAHFEEMSHQIEILYLNLTYQSLSCQVRSPA